MNSIAKALALTTALALPSAALAVPTPGNNVESSVKGQGGNFGLGATLIDPLGLSGKYYFTANHALQFSAGYSWLSKPSMFRVSVEYLWHPATLARTDIMDLVPYVGVGLGFGFGGTTTQMIFRAGVVGLSFNWKTVRLDTFIEGNWAPGIEFRAGGYGRLGQGDFAMGIRYYF